MKLKALLMLLWLPLTALAQTTQKEAVIIDAQTCQPLPYASIFISRANSTITNAEGKFHIFCSPDDVLRTSYVGYKTQQITARNLSSKIQLEPITSMLNEVTIMPLKAYLDKAIKETMRQIGKYHRKKAFKNVRDEYINTDFHFTVTMTEDRGFLEVQSVAIDEQHEFHGRKLHSNSILFNVGDRVIGKGKKLKKDDNILIDIGNQEYDPQFWSDNDIVRRTPVEEDVFQLFESKKLFGVFK